MAVAGGRPLAAARPPAGRLGAAGHADDFSCGGGGDGDDGDDGDDDDVDSAAAGKAKGWIEGDHGWRMQRRERRPWRKARGVLHSRRFDCIAIPCDHSKGVHSRHLGQPYNHACAIRCQLGGY